MTRCGTATRRNGRAGRRRRDLVEDGSRCQSPSPGDCECVGGTNSRSKDRRFSWNPRWQHPIDSRRTPTGTRSLLRSECEWKQGESSDGGQFAGRTKEGMPPAGRQETVVAAEGESQNLAKKKNGKKCGNSGASRWSAV